MLCLSCVVGLLSQCILAALVSLGKAPGRSFMEQVGGLCVFIPELISKHLTQLWGAGNPRPAWQALLWAVPCCFQYL